MSCKVDLHTHSVASLDGSLSARDYRRMLDAAGLNVVAVTDHDRMDFALKLHHELGERIIVGEEISAREGEIIGLYLSKPVEPGLTAAETVEAIHGQGGIVYIPHPLETIRHGLPLRVLEAIAPSIDIVEVYNGRAVFQNKSAQAGRWAARHNLPAVASSDAHGWSGWGRTYSILAREPSRENIVDLFRTATYCVHKPTIPATLYPKFNRLRKKLGGA